MSSAWTLYLILQEVAGKPVAPSWGAYAGLVTLAFLIIDRIFLRGRREQGLESKIDALCDKIEDFEHAQSALDTHLRSLTKIVEALTYEMKGTDGQNGAKGAIKEIRQQLAAIEERNKKMDILAALYEQERDYKGPERREHLRRLKDDRRGTDNP